MKKIIKMLMVTVIGCLGFASSANAEEFGAEFQKFAGNGTITITDTTYGPSIENALIYQYTKTWNIKNGTNFEIVSCDDPFYNSCTIALKDEEGSILEQHDIAIQYEEKYSEDFKKLTSGTIVVKGSSVNSETYFDGGRTWIQIHAENYIKEVKETTGIDFKIKGIVDNRGGDIKLVIAIMDTDGTVKEQHLIHTTTKDEYSEQFKEVIKDQTFTVRGTTIGTKSSMISTQLSAYRTNDSFYSVSQCNEDQTICDIVFYQNRKVTDTYWESVEIERHAVKIIYDESYSEKFKTEIGSKITLNGSTIGEKRNLLYNYFNSYSNGNYYYNVGNCNEDKTVCDIILQQPSAYSTELERHPVSIVYEEEQYSEDFKKLTDNKELTVKSVKPKDQVKAYLYVATYLSILDLEDINFTVGSCNEDGTICDVISSKGETHALHITYVDVDADILKKMQKYISTIPENKSFILEDLELINFMVNVGYHSDNFEWNIEKKILNYSSEFKGYFNHMNAKFNIDNGGGFGTPISLGYGGVITVAYEGAIYGYIPEGVGFLRRHVIYIPDTTEDTKEAYIQAAQKRIKEYFKNDNVQMIYGGNFAEIIQYADAEEAEFITDMLGFDVTKVDSYYNLTYNENTIPFVIVKDSSKIKEEVKYENNDIVTGISISTTSPDVPLDTTIQATEITKENTQYQEITAKLKIKEAIIYDLKLFSSTTKQFISKLKDGLFQVKIPIPESMLNKNLAAYYIREDGKIEEHPITVMDGLAYFTTDHFSVYTITEKIELEDVITEKVPNTYDEIMNYVGLGVIGLIGLSISGLTYKKRENE